MSSFADSATIREKTTSPFVFDCEADGAAINLTLIDHIELHMIDKVKKTYQYSSGDASPAIVVTDAANGRVTFTPPDENVFLYKRSPYKIYVKIYNTATEAYTVPEDTHFELEILKEY